MIQAIAIDDDRSALTVLDAYCQRAKGITLTRIFTQPKEARLYLQQNRVNLVFMEPHVDYGVDLWQALQQWAGDTQAVLPQLVFTSSHGQYAQLSYELQALDYLLKPFSFERFSQTIQKANDQPSLSLGKPKSLAVYRSFRVDYGLVNINLLNISCVEALGNYCKLYFINQRPVVVRTTMKAILHELAPLDFIQVHRSYIVALGCIEAIHGKQIYLSEKQVPLGSNFDRTVHSRFEKLAHSSQHLAGSSPSSVSQYSSYVQMTKYNDVQSN